MTIPFDLEITPEQFALALNNADRMGCCPEIAIEIAITEYLHTLYSTPEPALIYLFPTQDKDHAST